MRNIILLVAASLIATFPLSAADARGGGHSSYGGYRSSSGYHSSGAGDHYVSGYYRSNGTYVSGYHATNPNSTRNDNYSTRGNVNPYTGEAGTKPRDGEGPD